MQPLRLLQILLLRRPEWGVLLVAMVVTLLPARALRPWTGDLARLASLPVTPLAHAGNLLADRLRPRGASFDPRAPEVVALEAEAELYRTLFEQSRLEVERLERTMAALGAVSTRAGGSDLRLTEASVIGVDPARTGGAVRINAGERHGVRPGAPVFVDGDVFVGLVSDEVGALESTVVPANRLPSLGARLYPAEQPSSTSGWTPPGAVLKPRPDGRFTAEVATTVDLAVGMIARLADDRSPRIALGARIGRVVAIEPVEQAPLARRIVVDPIVLLEERATVVVASTPPASPIPASAPSAARPPESSR